MVPASEPEVIVAIPTLTGGDKLRRCVDSVLTQTHTPLRVLVIEDGVPGVAAGAIRGGASILTLSRNSGYATALNAALAQSSAPYLLALNDDTEIDPDCVKRLLECLERHPDASACAPRIVRMGRDVLDSAGMAVARDGTCIQRGHGQPSAHFSTSEDVFCASGCAALYRRSALEEAGFFDESLFLYCEDGDVGMRCARLGWTCRYVPEAVVYHEYSATVGPASLRKLYLVERNRILVNFKNLSWAAFFASFWFAFWRYGLHALSFASGRGLEGRARRSEGVSAIGLAWTLLRAHWDALVRLPGLWPERRRIDRLASLSRGAFTKSLRRYRVSLASIAGRHD
ncbi:MAG: glycosyltransferase family 2 protein [Bryobacteraceae bacterium]|nr:glycosyltransferase family 2 protein [Bryobacteraceae bacterium]